MPTQLVYTIKSAKPLTKQNENESSSKNTDKSSNNETQSEDQQRWSNDSGVILNNQSDATVQVAKASQAADTSTGSMVCL